MSVRSNSARKKPEQPRARRKQPVRAAANIFAADAVRPSQLPADAENAPALSDICDFLLDRGIAKFKLPERVEHFDALPRNPMGKVVRSDLQAAIELHKEHTS